LPAYSLLFPAREARFADFGQTSTNFSAYRKNSLQISLLTGIREKKLGCREAKKVGDFNQSPKR
jgi:hypothetical protein